MERTDFDFRLLLPERKVVCNPVMYHKPCCKDPVGAVVMLLQGGSGAHALAKALRPTTHRLSAADARLLEESLRFGATKLFSADLEAAERLEEQQHTPSTSGAAVRASVDATQNPKTEADDSAAAKGSPEAEEDSKAMDTEPVKEAAEAGATARAGAAKSGAKDSETQSAEGGDGGDDPVEQQAGGSSKDGELPLSSCHCDKAVAG